MQRKTLKNFFFLRAIAYRMDWKIYIFSKQFQNILEHWLQHHTLVHSEPRRQKAAAYVWHTNTNMNTQYSCNEVIGEELSYYSIFFFWIYEHTGTRSMYIHKKCNACLNFWSLSPPVHSTVFLDLDFSLKSWSNRIKARAAINRWAVEEDFEPNFVGHWKSIKTIYSLIFKP